MDWHVLSLRISVLADCHSHLILDTLFGKVARIVRIDLANS